MNASICGILMKFNPHPVWVQSRRWGSFGDRVLLGLLRRCGLKCSLWTIFLVFSVNIADESRTVADSFCFILLLHSPLCLLICALFYFSRSLRPQSRVFPRKQIYNVTVALIFAFASIDFVLFVATQLGINDLNNREWKMFFSMKSEKWDELKICLKLL